MIPPPGDSALFRDAIPSRSRHHPMILARPCGSARGTRTIVFGLRLTLQVSILASSPRN